jgi:hypothetical protein
MTSVPYLEPELAGIILSHLDGRSLCEAAGACRAFWDNTWYVKSMQVEVHHEGSREDISKRYKDLCSYLNSQKEKGLQAIPSFSVQFFFIYACLSFARGDQHTL